MGTRIEHPPAADNPRAGIVPGNRILAWQFICAAPSPGRLTAAVLLRTATSPGGAGAPLPLSRCGVGRRTSGSAERVARAARRVTGCGAGLGCSWMPARMVEADPRAGRLVALVLERNAVQVGEAGLIFRSTPPLGPTGRQLLDASRSEPDLPPPLPADLLNMYEMP